MLPDTPITRKPGQPPRKWMSDDFFDLIVWYAPDQSVHGFQLCYDKDEEEKAITWIRGKGLQHSLVDTGEVLPTENHSPVLVHGGAFPATRVRGEFLRRSVNLSPKLRRLVLSKLSSDRLPLARIFLFAVGAGICFTMALGYARRNIHTGP